MKRLLSSIRDNLYLVFSISSICFFTFCGLSGLFMNEAIVLGIIDCVVFVVYSDTKKNQIERLNSEVSHWLKSWVELHSKSKAK